MCDPVTAAGLALSAGGTFLQQREATKNANRATDARNQAFEANQIRQRQYADEAGAAFNQTVESQGKENFDEEREVEGARLEKAFQDSRVRPDYSVGLRGSAPKNVVIARENEANKAGAETDRDVGNLADLFGYQGAMFNTGLDRNSFGRAFGNINSKAAADNNLLPIEMQAAATNSQKAPSLFPTLLKAGGQGLSMFGGAGGSFSNTVEGAVKPGTFGPGAPQTSYGLFMDQKPVNLFGYQLAGRV